MSMITAKRTRKGSKKSRAFYDFKRNTTLYNRNGETEN